MTTIAFKNGVIAYDSRETEGNVIASDNVDKKIVTDDGVYFLAGTVVAFNKFITALENEEELEYNEDMFCSAFCVVNGKIYETAYFNKGVGLTRLDGYRHWAIGSGASWAIAAMDMGKSAAEAVKYAMTRDTFTGGKIRTYKFK